MFNTIMAELGRRGWTMKDLSVESGIQYDSLRNKLTGKTEFTRSEMLNVKRSLAPHIPLDELFEENNKSA